LTNLNASNITSGTVPSASLSGAYTSALSFTSPGNAFVGDGSGLTNLNAQARLLRTVVVSPLGTPAQNGTALILAVKSIVLPSATNQWLVKVEPGTYDVSPAGSLLMRPFVDIEGSGEAVTKITATGNATNTVGTVQIANNSELRRVTVESTGA